jgi:hypothetical protein
MVLLDLKPLDRWSEASPIQAYIHASQVLQAGLLDRAVTAATDEQLAEPETFRLVIFEALRTGLSATELGILVGAAKTTVARWAIGEAVPRYAVARSLFARKVLTRLQEHCEEDLQRYADQDAIRIEGHKVVGDLGRSHAKTLEPA